MSILSQLSTDEQKAVAAIEAKAEALVAEIHSYEALGSREISLAKTKVEEAVLWFRQHVLKQAAAKATASTITPPTGTVSTEGSAPTKS